MKINTQDLLTSIIKDSLRELNLDKFSQQAQCLDISTSTVFGDYSSNLALRIASETKKAPFEIANSIVDNIKKRLEKEASLKEYLKEIRVEGQGFINFYFHDKYFQEELRRIVLEKSNFARIKFGKSRRVLIEFVSANPTGPLSVAHARQAAVGDCLANILDFSGFKVKREYYLNDEGNQINILGESIGLRLQELNGEKIEFPPDHYQGEYIYDIAKKIKNEKFLPGRQAGKIKNFSEYGVKYILEIIKKELDDFGVRFDYWYSQKELRKSGKIKKALDYLKQKGFLYEREGAVWFKTTEFSDDKDRVVIKSDGSYTYLAPDIAYHRDKFSRGFDRLINLWGPDHHGYVNRLKAAVGALGKDPASLAVIIVQLASIFREGKPIQMSTRKGQYITLREVLDEVGLDASRFFFLMRRTSSHLDFDLAIAKKQTQENPVYYVQYAHARICSILRNTRARINFKKLDLAMLREKEEIELIKKLWRLPYILNIILSTLDPYMLTVYLQEVSEEFHKFYDRHRVLGQDESITQARLALLEGTKTVLGIGLELLGISRPQKM